jgi:hypothetical protein
VWSVGLACPQSHGAPTIFWLEMEALGTSLCLLSLLCPSKILGKEPELPFHVKVYKAEIHLPDNGIILLFLTLSLG